MLELVTTQAVKMNGANFFALFISMMSGDPTSRSHSVHFNYLLSVTVGFVLLESNDRVSGFLCQKTSQSKMLVRFLHQNDNRKSLQNLQGGARYCRAPDAGKINSPYRMVSSKTS